MDILTTVLLGVGTVFIGLICLVLIIELTHVIVSAFDHNKKTAEKPAVLPAAPDKSSVDEIEHGTLTAIIAAAVAEELGKDVEAIRIRSIRKV